MPREVTEEWISKKIDSLNEEFMAIIQEFAPNWYPHLVDSDQNKGEFFRESIENALTEAVEQEREVEKGRAIIIMSEFIKEKGEDYPLGKYFTLLCALTNKADEV